MTVGKSIQEAVSAAIRDVAPTVARELIPGSALAGRALREVSQILTGKPDAPGETVKLHAESMTVEQVAALEGLEAKRVERERIAAGDRQDARARQRATKDLVPAILAALIIGSLIAFKVLLFFVTPPLQNMEAIEQGDDLLEYLAIAAGAFFFGSTIDSRKKTDMIGRR